ncbi:unnamed protein product [Caenorhabditis angaria]|uniref:Phospholipid scramblase n=1 Tax=Caenorhabditis angaria TaxID=860376 RepID=A0A9P1IS68_9PELO|nr:unnamed protein product [Caenorhabditis angaria]
MMSGSPHQQNYGNQHGGHYNNQPGHHQSNNNNNKRRRGGARLQPRNTPLEIANPIMTIPPIVQVVVHLPPHGALNVINATTCILVQQCVEVIEVLTDFETSNRYIVHDMFMRPILYAYEVSGVLGRVFAGSYRNFDMMFSDLYGQTVMRGLRRTNSGDTFRLEYPIGNLIGVVIVDGCCAKQMIIRMSCGGPDLHVVYPSCVSGCGTSVFPVVTGNDQKVGEIVRCYPGFFKQAFTDADMFLVHFNPGLPIHFKLMLMAAVFLTDFVFFEDDPYI